MTTAISYFISTGFYSGRSPGMPGTAGSLTFLALWFFIEWSFQPSITSWSLIICIIGLIGVLSTEIAMKSHSDLKSKGSDPSAIVIDEWCGQAIALVGVSSHSELLYALLAFGLFRFFDILKPFPVSSAEKLPGAYGIMADDIVAGVLALVLLLITRSIL